MYLQCRRFASPHVINGTRQSRLRCFSTFKLSYLIIELIYSLTISRYIVLSIIGGSLSKGPVVQ